MRVLSLAAVYSIFGIAFAHAQYVDVTAVLRTTSTSAIATGGAQYHYANGSAGTVGISGFLSLYEDSFDVSDKPFTGFNGFWQGTITFYGDAGSCYQAGIDAHGVDTGVSTSYSGTACITGQYNPPPYSHGYDTCPLILDLDADGIPTTGLEIPSRSSTPTATASASRADGPLPMRAMPSCGVISTVTEWSIPESCSARGCFCRVAVARGTVSKRCKPTTCRQPVETAMA
jgi:hypothetical protein